MNLTLFEKQQWLEVSRSCDWMCLGCPLVSSVTQALHIQKTVDKLKSSGYVNIYGGNPFMYVHFLKLIVFLTKKNPIKLAIWSHPLDDIDRYVDLVPYIKKWFIYVPTVLPDVFEEFVESCTYSDFKAHLYQLKEARISFQLVHFVTPYTISVLPDIYELAFLLEVPLIIVYNTTSLSKNEVKYVKRFLHVKKVRVFFTRNPLKNCLGAPTQAFTRFQIIKNEVYEALNGIRSKFKL